MSILLSLVATMSLQAIGETVSDETLKDEMVGWHHRLNGHEFE